MGMIILRKKPFSVFLKSRCRVYARNDLVLTDDIMMNIFLFCPYQTLFGKVLFDDTRGGVHLKIVCTLQRRYEDDIFSEFVFGGVDESSNFEPERDLLEESSEFKSILESHLDEDPRRRFIFNHYFSMIWGKYKIERNKGEGEFKETGSILIGFIEVEHDGWKNCTDKYMETSEITEQWMFQFGGYIFYLGKYRYCLPEYQLMFRQDGTKTGKVFVRMKILPKDNQEIVSGMMNPFYKKLK